MRLGQESFCRLFGDRSPTEFMPDVRGFEIATAVDEVEIVRGGIEATGEPSETVFQSGRNDELVAERFSHAASQTAAKYGSFVNFDIDFASDYLRILRYAILREMLRKSGVEID